MDRCGTPPAHASPSRSSLTPCWPWPLPTARAANASAPPQHPPQKGMTMTTPADLTVAPPPARPGALRPAAPDQFLELQRRVKAAGLLDPRPGYYTAKIAFNLLLLAGGWATLVLVGN